MTDTFAQTAAAVLMATGVATELNLLGALVNEWRDARCDRRRRVLRRTRIEARRGTNRSEFAAAVGLVMLASPGIGLAQTAASSDAAQPVTAPTTADAPLTVSSDRPSFSDGTGIQPLWHLNVETGYTFTHRDRDGVETDRHNAPDVLLRLGLIDDWLEAKFFTTGYVWSDTGVGAGSISTNDWSDIGAGLKLKLSDQNGWFPRLAIEGLTTIGAGGGNASTQEVEPVFKLLWSTDLGAAAGDSWKGWTVGGNLNVALPTTNGERFTQFQGSVYASFPIVEGVSGFAEYYVLAPNAKDSDAAHYADIGAVWLVAPRVQLDARVRFGLNNEADNVFAGLGVSVLF